MADPTADIEPIAPRWAGILGTLISVAGLGVSAYLTYAHYTSVTVLACPDKGFVNCAKVTTSVYSHILGVPVALIGLCYFAVMVVLQSPPLWRSTDRRLRVLRLAGAASGMVMVLWLLYAELFKIHNICIYCTSVHGLTFLLFVVTALGTAWTAPIADEDDDDEEGVEPLTPSGSSARVRP